MPFFDERIYVGFLIIMLSLWVLSFIIPTFLSAVYMLMLMARLTFAPVERHETAPRTNAPVAVVSTLK